MNCNDPLRTPSGVWVHCTQPLGHDWDHRNGDMIWPQPVEHFNPDNLSGSADGALVRPGVQKSGHPEDGSTEMDVAIRILKADGYRIVKLERVHVDKGLIPLHSRYEIREEL